MIIVFRNETQHCKLESIDSVFNTRDTWMCCECGEGEEEIDNHGRSRVTTVSSQGTICNIGRLNGSKGTQDESRKANSRDSQKVQDVRKDSNSLPIFSSFSRSHKRNRKVT